MIGKHSVNDKVIEEVLNSLVAHELIKVRVLESCNTDRKEVAESLATACNAQVAQILGRTILLYKKGDLPVIDLP
jgi:RNA-binding protein